LDRASGYGPEG